jgi:hypothetical protein
MPDGVNELVEQLRAIEETLRDLAYDRLQEAAGGDDGAAADEKRLHALGGESEPY